MHSVENYKYPAVLQAHRVNTTVQSQIVCFVLHKLILFCNYDLTVTPQYIQCHIQTLLLQTSTTVDGKYYRSTKGL